MTIETKEKTSSWLDRPFPGLSISWEAVLFIGIVILAIVTRFYDLGARVMSHDESLHTYFSWNLYRGDGFNHTPLMHGPFQFNIIALFYYLFGDSDFSARIPAVLLSIASVGFFWKYRRYLGRSGALITSFLFVISPFMLYYGRYVRNEAYVIFFGIVAIWATLRYLDTGENKYLYYLTAATAFHFTAKETSFIYVAQTLVFLGFVFLNQLYKRKWKNPGQRNLFFILLVAAGLLFIGGLSMELASDPDVINAGEIAAPADPELGEELITEEAETPPLARYVLILGAISFGLSLVILAMGYGLENLRKMRSFGLMVLQFFMVVPHLSAFLIRWAELDPMNYSNPVDIPFLNLEQVHALVAIGIFLLPLIIISFAVGMWWNSREWLINNAIFYVIFVVFFTTIFSNGSGFFSGLVGSLGYWLEQQGVARGSQPSYYYVLVQIPVYEFLPALGTLLAGLIGVRMWWKGPANSDKTEKDNQDTDPTREESQNRALLFFGFWAITSLLAYTLAGEKMPWLTVHIAFPMILMTGWVLGYLIEKLDWDEFKENHGWTAFGLLPILGAALVGLVVLWITAETPFEGKTLDQLEDTSTFLLTLLTTMGVLIGLINIFKNWQFKQTLVVILLSFFSILTIMTMKASFIATYVNYDQATEYLVYAHSARGVKDVMERVEDISLRTTDGLALDVAFDDDVSWPFNWYLRNYTNRRFYGAEPTRDLRNAAIIIVGDNNFSKIEPIVAQGYYRFDYIRMWWPMQDYFDLTSERVNEYLTDPGLRAGLLDIWLARDYTAYGNAVGRDYTLPNWSPADRMRMYIRKDVAAQLWDYGIGTGEAEIVIDPYEGKQLALVPDQILSTTIEGNSLFNAPRDLAIAPNGDIYVADSKNNRIIQIRDNEVINQWGQFGGSVDGAAAPEGTFNEPWGIAVSADGEFVYVADTWNHRIQKFTADGDFVSMWGIFQQNDDPYSFWGPRDVEVAPDGNILVSNTGNKRIAAFTPDGEFVTQFGDVGFGLGEFDEPVGIGINQTNGWVYIADTWNQRIQVFAPSDVLGYTAINSWDIIGWYGQNLDNKPFITVDTEGNVYITDPEFSRILVYNAEGEFLNYFGDAGLGADAIGIASSVAIDSSGDAWITDGQGNRLLHFTLP